MSRPTQVALLIAILYPYGAFTLCDDVFQRLPVPNHNSFERSYNPGTAVTAPV